jgi:hypothetical protein
MKGTETTPEVLSDNGLRYGILDTQDNVWIGDSHGPKLFTECWVARVAAQVFETQAFGTDLAARYKATPFPAQPVRHKDDVPVKMDTLSALKRCEGE